MKCPKTAGALMVMHPVEPTAQVSPTYSSAMFKCTAIHEAHKDSDVTMMMRWLVGLMAFR